MSETMIMWYHIALWFVAVPTTVYPLAYTLWFKWWESSLGRALFTKSLVLGILIDYTLATSYGHLANIKVAVSLLFCLGVAVWYQIIVMSKVKYSAKEDWGSLADTHLSMRSDDSDV